MPKQAVPAVWDKSMKFVLLLGGVIAVGTAVGLAIPASHEAAVALAPGEELVGTASQVVPEDRKVLYAGMLASAQAVLRVGREQERPWADAANITTNPGNSIRVSLPLQGGGQVNILYTLEDLGPKTRITQTMTLSGPVSPETRRRVEILKILDAFKKAGGGIV